MAVATNGEPQQGMEVRKVLISDPINPLCVKILNDAGIEVDARDKVPMDELVKIISDYDALIVRSGTTVTAEVLAAGNLKIVGRAGTGVDNIDLDAATKAGTIVLNTPGGNTVSAAEHTCAMLQSLCRFIPQSNEKLRAGKFDRKGGMGVELHGKTIGIIGLGRIGREVAKRMQAFDVKTIGYDPIMPKNVAAKFNIEAMDLDAVFAQSDFLTIHTPLTPQTKGLLGEDAFKKCKKGFRVVNCARGGIIDEEALLIALNDGVCAGAALDVFQEEPPMDSPISSKLIAHPLVIATPHLGASTKDAQVKVAVEIAESIVRATRGGALVGAVNAPKLVNAFSPEIKPYVALATKMGLIVSQVLGGDAFLATNSTIQSISLFAKGDLIKDMADVLKNALLTGLMSKLSDDPVNLINAHHYAKDLDFQINATGTDKIDDLPYKNVLSVSIDSADSTHTYEGVVVAGAPHLITINNFEIGAKPNGHVLFYSNYNTPGVLGKVAGVCGAHNLNIFDFNMGEENNKKVHMSVLNVESPVTQEALKDIQAIDGVLGVRYLDLE
ncbi:phosphoglycerate dehydrogenase [Sphaeroforma arctica JP610]|uniref:D-3-phosphoglycerate dehydrogenase n=1 Tax=Sphaeroforma arctica JP610 TaxID=667725 RepID=A0A0L0FZD4_9EUKA|nr:phosphoglycerate dehydrogenase [Sphaeroforma arctica JP610]KNC81328.1 phosphoglycerate dehydrogenase [Sphaeroforma arctica JP610]|eukprot:XP_014155230.1 phosphoglycerate dehydrogenase [Sphaeroforma arctica JP610]